MRVQKSFAQEGGILYIVGTPIGNLGDMSSRAEEILRQVELIAAEDTRHTGKLLKHFNIPTRMSSYHKYNQHSRGKELIERLVNGESIAIVSDAGMPTISDPGEGLVKEALEKGLPVVPIPGPNAALSSLVASGLPTQPFLFIGFLPRVRKLRIRELERWAGTPATLLFYEAPHRLLDTLKDMHEILGERNVAIARELTKKHEEWLRGLLSECIKYTQTAEIRGEYTIVIEGASGDEKVADSWWEGYTLVEHVNLYIEKGMDKKEAILLVAKDRDLPKREVYNAYHREV